MKTRFEVGDKVRWDYLNMRWPRQRVIGAGLVTQVYEALGPMPTNYAVTGASRVLFDDELKRA